jgi:hypothetical protein
MCQKFASVYLPMTWPCSDTIVSSRKQGVGRIERLGETKISGLRIIGGDTVIPFVTEPAIGLDDGKSIRDDTKMAWKALGDGDSRVPSTRVAARAIATLLFLYVMQFFARALDQKILQLFSIHASCTQGPGSQSGALKCVLVLVHQPGMMRPPLERPALVPWDFPRDSRVRSGPPWSQGFPFCT